jgi:hypothetical protein
MENDDITPPAAIRRYPLVNPQLGITNCAFMVSSVIELNGELF